MRRGVGGPPPPPARAHLAWVRSRAPASRPHARLITAQGLKSAASEAPAICLSKRDKCPALAELVLITTIAEDRKPFGALHRGRAGAPDSCCTGAGLRDPPARRR